MYHVSSGMQTFKRNPVNARKWLVNGVLSTRRGVVRFSGRKSPTMPTLRRIEPLCLFHLTGSGANSSHCGSSGKFQRTREMSDLSDEQRSLPCITIWLTKQPFFCSVISSKPIMAAPMVRTNTTRVSRSDTSWAIRARRMFQNCAVRDGGQTANSYWIECRYCVIPEDKRLVLKRGFRRRAFLPFGNDFAQKNHQQLAINTQAA